MTLGTLSLSVTAGVQGRPFAAKINGLTTGKVEVLSDGAPGFSISNGILRSEALPYALSTAVVREYDPGASPSVKDTRLEITATTALQLVVAAAAAVAGGRVAIRSWAAATKQPDGSLVWSGYVEDDYGSTVPFDIGSGTPTPTPTPTLATLSLSGSLTNGTSGSGTITGATIGSTIVSNVSGLTVNSGARTYTWDGSGAAGTTASGLVETLAGANGSPKSSAVTVAASGSTPSYVGPDLVAQSSPTTYPPAPTLVTKVYHPVGSKLRVRVAPTYADLIAGTNLIVNDASFTLSGNAATNQAGLAAKLAGISSGKTFIDVRVEESPTVFSARSNPIMHGSSAVPAPQASVAFNVYSTLQLSAAISFAEPVYLSLLGDDQISFELTGPQPGTAFTLRWADNGTKTYAGVDDFNLDYIYDLILRRRSLADATADTASTTTLLDYDVMPDAFTFTDIANATRSTAYESNTITVAGMVNGYTGTDGNITGGQYSKNGGAYTSATPFSYINGDTFKVKQTSSASYFTPTNTVLTLGPTSDTYTVTTLADPTSVVPTFHPITSEAVGYGSRYSAQSVTLKTGVNVVFVGSTYLPVQALTVPGCTVTFIDSSGSGNTQCFAYKVVAPSDGTYTATADSGSTNVFQDVFMAAVNLSNAASSASEVDKLPFSFNASPGVIGNGTTCPAGGVILAFVMAGDPVLSSLAWSVGTQQYAVTTPEASSIALLTTSGTPTVTYTSNSISGIAVAWGHS